jgi:hypothetical protein
MLFIKKKGFTMVNGKLKQKFNIEMKKTNEGYNIIGYDNNKLIHKSVRYNKKINKTKNKSKNKSKNKKLKVKK